MKLISVILILNLVSLNSYSQTCQEVLNNCDQAYVAQKQMIKDQDAQIANYFQKDQLQTRIAEDQKKQLDSPFKDPVKMVGLGVVGTIVVEIMLGVFKR